MYLTWEISMELALLPIEQVVRRMAEAFYQKYEHPANCFYANPKTLGDEYPTIVDTNHGAVAVESSVNTYDAFVICRI